MIAMQQAMLAAWMAWLELQLALRQFQDACSEIVTGQGPSVGGTRTRPPKKPKKPDPGEPENAPDPGVRCFVAGTRVLTPQGSTPIQEVKPGDLVLARNEHNGALAFKRVIRVHCGYTKRVCTIRISRLASDDNGEATSGHASSEVTQAISSTPGHDYFRLSDCTCGCGREAKPWRHPARRLRWSFACGGRVPFAADDSDMESRRRGF